VNHARLLAVAVTVALAAAVTAAPSRGDGDPASDYLLTQNVYYPVHAPSGSERSALDHAVDVIYAHGDRVKVALVYDVDDLGSIPSLFGKPDDYARFLGIELGLWYVGPLLVVMPAGFGIYDGGRPTTAEEQVLHSVSVAAQSPDALTRSMTTALERLAAAGALSSPDITAPKVSAHPASAKRGRTATLHFDVFDDSGRSRTVVRVYEALGLVATLRSPWTFKIGTRAASIGWPVPKTLTSRRLRFCVIAVDTAGNHSPPSCAPFLRIT
jgi:hypothetical protein